MCGILAVLRPSATVPSPARHARRAEHLLDRLVHRGPDGRATRMTDHAWLGHRRLAIVDPAGGAQPLHDGGISWIANAEIYNHAELGALFGAAAGTTSDIAPLGPAWRVLGAELPRALDAQFAFVCVDESTGHWIATRDHMGICPLYLGRHADGTIWFASEMKALIDDCASVELVQPGHAWIRDATGLRCERWYDPSWRHRANDRLPTHAHLRQTLIGAVDKRLMSDVPWGVLLSGGIDSSVIAAITARRAVELGIAPIHSFSIGLRGASDLAPARQVADHLGTIHHEYTFTIDEAMAALPQVVEHLESDQQIRTGVPTFLLGRRIAADGFKMALSGEGADEIFGGYLYFHSAPSPDEFHAETVRKTTRLHQYDVMRANKAPMASGLELRFPFLDRDVIELVMSAAPEMRMPRPGPLCGPIEKAFLREAFEGWLPAEILWRQKEQFSDGCGYAWVDELRRRASMRYDQAGLLRAASAHPDDPPANAEMLWMRELFDARFVHGRCSGVSARTTTGSGRSIACSSPEAVTWDPTWEHLAGDISGRALAGLHESRQALAS